MSRQSLILHPLLLHFRSSELEATFRQQQIDAFPQYLPSVVFVLVVMNVVRIILYSVDEKGEAEIGWSVPLLVLSLSLRCLLWVRRLKVPVVVAAGVILYLTCAEWIVSFDEFFCFEVRAIIVVLGLVNVYMGLFLFAWCWWLFFLGMALGALYLILRTNLYFDEQDVPSQIFTSILPAFIVYLQQRSFRLSFHSITTSNFDREKWSELISSLPCSLIVLDLDSILFMNPAASEFLQVQDLSAVYGTQAYTALKACYRKDNPAKRLEEEWKELLAPTQGGGSDRVDATFILVRDDGAHHSLQIALKAVNWEPRRKAVAITFLNVTKLVHTQSAETRVETAALMGACVTEMVRPALVRVSGEMRMKNSAGQKRAETQLLGVYYGLYCLEDIEKSLTGGDMKHAIKSVSIRKEIERIQEINQETLQKYSLGLDYIAEYLPDTIKIDQIRYRQFLSLLIHALSPSALPSTSLHLKLTPKHSKPLELQTTLTWTRDTDKPQSHLLQIAEKLARKLSSEGLKLSPNTVKFGFYAGFVLERALSDISLDVPEDEEQKGVMPPQNQYGIFSAKQ